METSAKNQQCKARSKCVRQIILANYDGTYRSSVGAFTEMYKPPKAIMTFVALQPAVPPVSRTPVYVLFLARCFYKLINRISKTDIVDGARDYRLMTRQMVNAIIDMGEYNRFRAIFVGRI